MDPSLVDLIVSGGPMGVLVVGIILVLRGNLRLDREYREMREDRNKWREFALRTTDAAGEAVTLLRSGGTR